jgi:hypothetical protein
VDEGFGRRQAVFFVQAVVGLDGDLGRRFCGVVHIISEIGVCLTECTQMLDGRKITVDGIRQEQHIVIGILKQGFFCIIVISICAGVSAA